MAWLFNQIPENNWTNMVINGLGIEPTAVYPFTVTLNSSQGDPAYGCQKTFTSTYNCGSKSSPVKNISIPASADNKVATFNCSDEANKCNNLKLTLADNGQLLLTTLDGKTTLWDSVTAGLKTVNPDTVLPATLMENIPNNKPLTVPDYAGDSKPHPTVDVGAGEGPGRRYNSNVLLPGQFLEEGQWIGSPKGTCRLMMGTPDKPNALQVVTSILGCNSLDAPFTVTNTKLTDLGCWNDSGNRALSRYLGQANSKEECAALAQENGSNIFGLQYYGQCFANLPGDNYKKYGKSRKPCTDLGTDWQNHVYKIQSSVDTEATRVYTVPELHNENIGKVAYVNNEGQLQLYPDTTMTMYQDEFEKTGNYNINGASLGSSFKVDNIETCKEKCSTEGDTQKCAGFVFDTTAARCQLLDKTLNVKQRIIDPNYQYYVRQKGVIGQDISCPVEAVIETTKTWNSMIYNSTNMTPTTKCGLAKFTEAERAAVANDLPKVYDNLQYKDKTGNVMDIDYVAAVNNPNARKTGFKYWYESLESKYSQLKNRIFNTNTSIEMTFDELQKSNQDLADWSGAQLQNLTAMNEDRDLNMMSQNYRHIMWSILAILIIMATMKMTKSVVKPST